MLKFETSFDTCFAKTRKNVSNAIVKIFCQKPIGTRVSASK